MKPILLLFFFQIIFVFPSFGQIKRSDEDKKPQISLQISKAYIYEENTNYHNNEYSNIGIEGQLSIQRNN